MINNRELVLLYLLITDQLRELVQTDFELDQEARFAIVHLFELLHVPCQLTNSQLGRAIRHGAYKRHVLTAWGIYFNSMGDSSYYHTDVQKIMQEMAEVRTGKTFTLPDVTRWPLSRARALIGLARQGKIAIRGYLPGPSKGLRLLVTPQVPVEEFDTPKGTWTYKGLSVSMKKPYVSYNGKDLNFNKGTDLFNIIKLCVKRAEELVPFTALHVECGKKVTASKRRRNQNIKNRIYVINSRLKSNLRCPLIHKDGESAVMK